MFSISNEDRKKIDSWLHETVYPPIIEQQRKNPKLSHLITVDEKGKQYPYFGANGGDLTYEFTPTSIGLIVKVVHTSGAVLDLTDYNSW